MVTKKDNFLKAKGVIRQKVRNKQFKVEMDNGLILTASVASKFKVARRGGRGYGRANIVVGDKVLLEIPINQTIIEIGSIVGFNN